MADYDAVVMKNTELENWAESPTAPTILSEKREGEVLELTLYVPAELFQFRGHFPGDPILPGVAQLDWVGRFARTYFGYQGGFTKLGQLKFSRLIKAETELLLCLELMPDKNRLIFTYSEDGTVCSSGFFELA
ncbi:hydroxymyristoyl-ACP dehydratase [Sneathiella sp.]|uniref:ApeI family dehydratase n=1 Tax=Sneathiella sp. TaxID=1964365 RepID=UPI0035680183